MKTILAIVIAVVVFAPAQGQAESKKSEAERFFRAGERAYNAGQYLVASRAFEEALKRFPVAAIKFSTAQAYRLQYFIDKNPQRLKRALGLYREYVAAVKKGGRRDDAVASIAELEPILLRLGLGSGGGQAMVTRVTQLMISTQVVGARASIGGKEGEVPLIREVEPGAHKIRVWADGYSTITQTSTAVDGRLVVVEVTLVAKPALIRLKTDSSARVSINGRPVGNAPFRAPLEIDAGKHVVTIAARGRKPWVKEIEVKRGEQIELNVDLARTTQRKLSYWVLGASAAMLGTAAVTGALAFSADGDASDLDKKRETEGLTPTELADYNEHVSRRNSRRKMTYVFLGAGATIGVAGTLMLFLDNPSPEASAFSTPTPTIVSSERRSLSVVPVITPDVAGVAAVGRF